LLQLEPKTFMGDRQRNWSSTDLCVDLSLYSAGCDLAQHQHTNAFFCFMLDGVCDEQASGFGTTLRADSLIYHCAGSVHSNHWHTAGRCMHVELAQSLCEGVNRARLTDPMPQIVIGRARDIARSIYDELLHVDSVSPIAFEGLALTLLAETIRETGRECNVPRWLRRIRDQLREEFSSVPSLGKIAAGAGVHPAYLATSFQQHYGVSVGQFVRMQRIERARNMLAHSDSTLSDTALLLGFSDQSHFCRTFKKQTGLTPLEYRRLFAGKRSPIQES
jgi:AraC family transcriptional regulator